MAEQRRTTSQGTDEGNCRVKATGRRFRAVGYCMLLCGACTVAWWGGRSASKRQSNTACLKIDASSLVFDEPIWGGRRHVRKVTVQNTTDQPIAIEGFVASCRCVQVAPREVALPPGGQATVEVSIDLRDANAERFVDRFDFAVKPLLTQPFDADIWRITGTARYVFRLSEPEVDFGRSLVHGQRFLPKEISVSNLTGNGKLFAKCDGQFARVETRAAEDDQWGVVVSLFPNDTLPVGEHHSSLTLCLLEREDGVWRESDRYPPMEVPILAHVRAPVLADPETVLLGIGRIGTVLKASTTLASVDRGDFEVLKVDTSNRAILDVQRDDNGGGTSNLMTFQITRKLQEPGIDRAEVTFRIRKSGEEYEIRIEVFAECLQN